MWASFAIAMTSVVGLLTLGGEPTQTGFVAANLGLVGDAVADDPVFHPSQPLDRARWSGIVIHHSGAPAGDAESLHRLHRSYGYQGLGFHFVIGNGNGLGDGVVHVGYRWNEQLPGAHTSGPAGGTHNQRSIGVCLVGNGDRRPFTERQVSSLLSLIRQLQRELGIPADQVFLHRDLATGVSSPGEYFPTSLLEEQLLADPR